MHNSEFKRSRSYSLCAINSWQMDGHDEANRRVSSL